MLKLILWIAYGVGAGAVLLFLSAQSLPPEKAAPAAALALPIAMLAGLVIRYLHKKQAKDDP
jgi:hypothetical protein